MKAKKANTYGGSGDDERGAWCTPKWLAEKLGAFDLDPCSNPRAHIDARVRLTLENGHDGLRYCVGPDERVFINPPYANGQVIRWFRAYQHTRFCFLLRFDPSAKAWFTELYRSTGLVCVPRGRRVNFEPPPGVTGSSNTIPHALFYKHAEDAPDALLRACIAWRPR